MKLHVADVSHSFGALEVLTRVHMDVGAGELATVLGRSGCGKTTLLRIIGGLLQPRVGTITLGERDITALPPQKRRVALVPQEGALFPHLNVARNVGFGLGRGGRGCVNDLLDLVGLRDLATRMPHEISGGQAQRVALARALAVEPDLVLLDEPFSALDSAARLSLRAEVRKLLRETGTTAILVTHDQEEALSLSDRVILMTEGKVVQAGTPDEVYHRPVSLAAARLTGSVHTLPAEATGATARTLIGNVPLHGTAAGTSMLLLRPEQLKPVAAPHGDWTVRCVTFHGASTDVELCHDDGTTVVARTQHSSWRPQDRATLTIEGSAAFERT